MRFFVLWIRYYGITELVMQHTLSGGVINNHVFQDVVQSIVRRFGEFSRKFGILTASIN
jgi:hypothetical protein